jgi:release factor glutamine methyltransferase
VRLITLPGVFKPISDSHMLADALREQTLDPRASVLDVCTGSGILAVTAARRGVRSVTAVDVSRRALATVRINARLNGVRVRAVRSNLFDRLAGQRFDAIVSNPPYVPCEADDLPTAGPQRAWEGGRDGRLILDRLIAEAPEHLRPGGFLLIVTSSILGTDQTLDAMTSAGLEPDIVARRRGPLGALMREQVARGLLPDVREEDVLVIRGRKPQRDRWRLPDELIVRA